MYRITTECARGNREDGSITVRSAYRFRAYLPRRDARFGQAEDPPAHSSNSLFFLRETLSRPLVLEPPGFSRRRIRRLCPEDTSADLQLPIDIEAAAGFNVAYRQVVEAVAKCNTTFIIVNPHACVRSAAVGAQEEELSLSRQEGNRANDRRLQTTPHPLSLKRMRSRQDLPILSL